MPITKNVLVNWYSIFNEKKIEKDSDEFLHKKLTLKVKFWLKNESNRYKNMS
jgi:hypothetical protein